MQEQVLYPISQKNNRLNVVWHPQNHGQFLTPVGYVCTLHDVLPYSRPDLAQDLSTLQEKALYWSRVKSASFADRVITVSEFSRREIIKHLDIDPKRVVAIHNGIDHNLFKEDKDEAKRLELQSRLNIHYRYMLTVGSYAPHKNLDVLLDAYQASELPKMGIGLVMVGPKDEIVYTSDHQTLETKVIQQGMDDMVKMLPPVSVNDLVTLYNNAELFCITSHFEGFGFPPLEAMSCGTPVVSSNSSSLPEVCGVAALYADPTDSRQFAENFNHLVSTPVIKEKMIALGRIQSQKFNWNTTASKTLETLVDVGIQYA
jgi:glycosyltransferase involved in cell wall biosynthesis